MKQMTPQMCRRLEKIFAQREDGARASQAEETP